jgi:trk system potassium uptake protein TrkA
MLPTRDSVLQEGDLLHLVMREETVDRVLEVYSRGPEED